MQSSKVSLVICVLALGTALTLRAEDTPAQAAARAALTSKLFEISEESPITNAPAAPTAMPGDKTVTMTQPTMQMPNEPVMTPAESAADAKAKAKAAKAEAKAKAKADAAKAAADLKAQKAAEKKAAAEKAAEVAAAKKQVQVNMAQPKPADVQTPMVMPAAPTAAETSATNWASMPPKMMPVMPTAPPLPISASKEQQLDDLLTKYKADQVTPEEYQKQRAAILGMP